jgi:hypothetical protein
MVSSLSKRKRELENSGSLWSEGLVQCGDTCAHH